MIRSGRKLGWRRACTVATTLIVALAGAAAQQARAAGDANSVSCPNETMTGFTSYLADCRAFEMVTPPYKDGYSVSSHAISEDGTRVLGQTLGTFAGELGPPQTRNELGLTYQFARGEAGWHTNPMVPANPEFRSASTFWGASHDLTKTLLSLPTAPAGEDDYYLVSPTTSEPIGPITPPGRGPTVEPAPVEAGPRLTFIHLEGATPDLSHIVFSVRAPFGWNGDTTQDDDRNIYEYVGGRNTSPTSVGVVGGPGSATLAGECGIILGSNVSKYNDISVDGSRLFFSVQGESVAPCGRPEPPAIELDARVNGAETVSVSASSPSSCNAECVSRPASDAVFEGASSDGARAFFLSTRQLTNDASEDSTPGDSASFGTGSGCPEAHTSGCNLYMYDFNRPAGENLLSLSSASATPHVQGIVRVSEDGSHVYFVAQGVLTSAPNARGQIAEPGANNLYVYTSAPGSQTYQIRFITRLAQGEDQGEEHFRSPDEPLWGEENDNDVRPAQATPDGLHLVFQSYADVTSDDSSEGVSQVFEYDAVADAVKRISVGDQGFNGNGNSNTASSRIQSVGYVEGSPEAQPLAVSADGSIVVFESENSLTPSLGLAGGQTGVHGIYENRDGRVFLVYGGAEGRTSLIGTTSSGNDIFFSTTDALTSSDTDTQSDIYDARVGGGSLLISSANCDGEGCRGPYFANPTFGPPGSSSQTADGNFAPVARPTSARPATRAQVLARALKRCQRTLKAGRRRRRCQAEARARYGKRHLVGPHKRNGRAK